MMNRLLEETLDEFDARYLECYNQLTCKLAAEHSAAPLALRSPFVLPSPMAKDEPPRLLLTESTFQTFAKADDLPDVLNLLVEFLLDQPFHYSASPYAPRSADVLPERPGRMRRLLLGLALTPKLQGRRGKDRRTPIAHVGNPFYKGKVSPRKAEKEKVKPQAG